MYYDEHPDAQHDIHELDVVLLGEQMKFLTDAGVFSKKMIDFGSQVLLSCLSFQQGESILDVGCGYGPLGLSLVKAQGIHATMVDVNTRALDLAQKNADLNQVEAKIFQSNVYDQVEGSFDHIISNPPIRAGKKVVHEVLSGSFDHLNPGGDLTIVIQKKQGAPSAKAKMEEVFGNCEILKKDKGYYILRSEKSHMRAVDIIQKKRDGIELSKDEIHWLIEGYVAGTVPDYQMAAFAMAVYFKGMTTREISDLTMKMVETGEQFDLSAIKGIKVDKHSTGGVGTK